MKKTMQVVGTIHCSKPRYWLDGEKAEPENGQVACDRILIKGEFTYKETDDGPEKYGYASVFLDADEYAAKWRENCGKVTIDVVTTTVERILGASGREYDNFSVTGGEYDPESLTFVEREKPSDRAAAFLARCKKPWSGFPKVIPTKVETKDDTSEDIANA